MDQQWLHAYVDESGTNELDTSKTGVSSFFICVAIIVKGSEVSSLNESLDLIAQDLCGNAEISSKRIGGNHDRRVKFLQRVETLNFGYHAMVIRKDVIWEDSGLNYKRSFYKFINKMLYHRLTAGGRFIKIIADEVGGQDFMASFQAYLVKRLKPDLFFDYTHEFQNSASCRLIQLADLVAGTLSHCFEPSKKGSHSLGFRKSLQSKELGIDVWPANFQSVDGNRKENHPLGLADSMLRRSSRFIKEREDSTEEIERMQVAVIRMLHFSREFEEVSRQLLHSDEIMRRLAQQGFEEISKRAFTKEVIGGIRTHGIIIAGTKNGYRFALNIEDINNYLDHNKNVIDPMLKRLKIARESVRFDTTNDHDILSCKPFHLLEKLVDCVSEFELEREVL